MLIPGLGAGGAERVVSNLANAWAETGDAVTIVTLDSPSQPPYFPLHPAIGILRLDTQRPSSSPLHAVRANLRRAKTLRTVIQTTHPHVVVSFIDQMNVLALFSLMRTGLPVIVCERVHPAHHPISPAWRFLRACLYPFARRVTVQTADAIGALPHLTRTAVIANAVAPMPRTPPENGKRMVAAGRLVHQKGFDLLLRAFAKGAAPDWRLDIWGEGPERSTLEHLASDLGLADRIRFPGLSTASGGWRDGADAFVLSSRYEGFPNVLLEAMAAGLPCAAFSCPGGPAEIITPEQDGLLVPPEQVEELAAALARLTGDSALRARLAEAAPHAVKRFAPTSILAVWDELLGGITGIRPRQESLRILFLARSMLRGGSERQLALLAAALVQKGHEITVALFYADGPLVGELRRAGVTVIDLAKRGRWDLPGFLWRLMEAVRRCRPHIIHGYLPVANLLALAAGLPAPQARIVFGLRASDMNLGSYDQLSALSYWLEARLSRFATLLIANSEAGKAHAIRRGHPADCIRVIANGIDTERFRPDPAARAAFRNTLNLPNGVPLIGMVARLDPMKDYETFLAAAALMATQRPDLHFVGIGDGPESYRMTLRNQAAFLGLANRLTFLPGRDDIESVYPGLDLLISSSAFGEGFSNVLAEAMACCVACVSTQVGDAQLVLGETGTIVPARDPAALAEAALAQLGHPEAGTAARNHIVTLFSVDRLAEATLAALSAPVRDHA